MTSNLGSDLILDYAEKNKDNEKALADGSADESSYEPLKAQINELLRRTFRPEFLNRIDEIVMFRQLGKKQISSIIEIQLQRLKDRLCDRKISLSFDQQAMDFLCDVGYDPTMGARPVKRAIQTYVENPLARELLSGKVLDGKTIKISCLNGKLVFQTE